MFEGKVGGLTKASHLQASPLEWNLYIFTRYNIQWQNFVWWPNYRSGKLLWGRPSCLSTPGMGHCPNLFSTLNYVIMFYLERPKSCTVTPSRGGTVFQGWLCPQFKEVVHLGHKFRWIPTYNHAVWHCNQVLHGYQARGFKVFSGSTTLDSGVSRILSEEGHMYASGSK